MSKHTLGRWRPPARRPRTKKAMIEYLSGHFRYGTHNGSSDATSYARCVKLQYLNFPYRQTKDTAFDLLGCDTDWWTFSGAHRLVCEFDRRWDWAWQIGSNGRCGGYLVLYQGGRKESPYQSYCTECGQQNCAHVVDLTGSVEDQVRRHFFLHPHWSEEIYLKQPEITKLDCDEETGRWIIRRAQSEHKQWNSNVSLTAKCGRCGADALKNYDQRPMETFCWLGRGVDMHEDWSEWDKISLEQRVQVVWDFDQTVDKIIAAFIDYCRGHEVVDDEVLVQKQVRVSVPRGRIGKG